LGITPVDLYRAGNAAGPRMDRLRPIDIPVIQQNGVDWVIPLSGGVSTNEQRLAPVRAWWLLPRGTIFSTLLAVRNDHGSHWVWEPAQSMELAEFLRLLASLNGEFVRV
jgi:hypothetical protein